MEKAESGIVFANILRTTPYMAYVCVSLCSPTSGLYIWYAK